MLVFALALMVAGVYGTTVGSLIGEFTYYACESTERVRDAIRVCEGPGIWDEHCVFSISYHEKVGNYSPFVNQDLCELKMSGGHWMFRARTKRISEWVESDPRAYLMPICEYKCEKKKNYVTL